MAGLRLPSWYGLTIVRWLLRFKGAIMSRNYLQSQAFRDWDASYNGRVWTAPANTHEPADAPEAEDEENHEPE